MRSRSWTVLAIPTMSDHHKLLSYFASAYWYSYQDPSRSLATSLWSLAIHLCHREGQNQRLISSCNGLDPPLRGRLCYNSYPPHLHVPVDPGCR